MNMSAIGILKPNHLPTNVAYNQKPHSNFCLLSYSQCEHAWSYIGKINILTRNLLNAAARNGYILSLAAQDFPRKIKNLTNHMKLLSIISVPFSTADLKFIAQKILKSFLHNDREGIALGTLSFIIISADAFDSTTTFVNSALAVASLEPIEMLASLGLPVAFVIAGLGTVSRSIQISKAFNLYEDINQEILSEEKYKNEGILKKFLDEKLGVENDKKKAALLRSAPKEAVEELERLMTLFASDAKGASLEKISNILNRIQQLLRKKMKIEAIGIIANMIIISALILFSMGTVGSLPFLLMAFGFLIRLLSLIYQDCTH